MSQFFNAKSRICDLTSFCEKSSAEVGLSLLEELGELCAELKIFLKVKGTEKKKPSEDGIYGEAVDTWICCVSRRWADEGLLLGIKEIGVLSKNAPAYNLEPIDIELAVQELDRIAFGRTIDLNELENLVLRIALTIDPVVENLHIKISYKLDKWEKNVNFPESWGV